MHSLGEDWCENMLMKLVFFERENSHKDNFPMFFFFFSWCSLVWYYYVQARCQKVLVSSCGYIVPQSPDGQQQQTVEMKRQVIFHCQSVTVRNSPCPSNFPMNLIGSPSTSGQTVHRLQTLVSHLKCFWLLFPTLTPSLNLSQLPAFKHRIEIRYQK